MKKQPLLALSICLLLVSCNKITDVSSFKSEASSSNSQVSSQTNTSNNDSSSNSTSSSSISKPIITGDVFKVEDIYNQLMYATNTNNYTVSYDYKSNNYEDVYNSNYFYYGLSETGYMLLESFENKNEKLAYRFSLINNEVKNLSAMATVGLDGSLTKINDLTKVDPLSYIQDDTSLLLEIKSSNKENMFTSSSTKLISAFSYALNVTASEVKLINLTMDKDHNIGFSLINDKGSIIEDGIGIISNIGTSSNDVVSSYQSSFKLPEKKIASSSLSSLSSSKLSALSNISFEVDGQIQQDSNKKVSVQYDEASKLQLTIFNSDNSISKVQTYIKEQAENLPKAVIEGVNGLNEVDTKISTTNWSDLYFASKYISIEAFREEKDGTYHYYGYQLAGLTYSLTYLPLNLSFASLDVKVENNLISKVNMSTNYGLNSSGKKARYILETDISNDVNFTPTTPYSSNSNTSKVAKILDKLSKKDSSYKATIVEKEDKYQQTEVVTVTPNTIFKDYSRNDNGQTSTYGKGFTFKDNGVVEFEQNKDGTLSARSNPNTNDSIFNHLPWKAKNEVFDIENNTLVLKNNVINIFKTIIVGDEGEGMDESSIKFTVNNESLTKIEFNYTSAIGTQGICTITFEYNNVDFSEDFKNKLNGLSYSVPTSWIDEGTHVYNDFHEYFTDEEIKSLPYVYDENLSKNWSTTAYGMVLVYNTKANSNNPYADYMTKLKEDAIKKGYVLDENDTTYKGFECYVNSNLKIKVYIGSNATAASGMMFEKY